MTMTVIGLNKMLRQKSTGVCMEFGAACAALKEAILILGTSHSQEQCKPCRQEYVFKC